MTVPVEDDITDELDELLSQCAAGPADVAPHDRHFGDGVHQFPSGALGLVS